MPTVSHYTVEIQAGNEDATIWHALRPAENLSTTGTAETAASDAFDNQTTAGDDDEYNPLLDDGLPSWRIVVWDGADADTGSTPAYILDDQTYRDQMLDAVERWEDARVDN
jgi:hypothetical protein